MRIRLVQFLMWLSERTDNLLERFDRCCYPGCENRADHWCITGGHRHCYEHESGFYSDVEFCQSCHESMTPEEIAAERAEAEQYEGGTSVTEQAAKWLGISELADEIQAEYGGESYTIAEAAEKVLRRALEPLLDRVETHLYEIDPEDATMLRKEIEPWKNG